MEYFGRNVTQVRADTNVREWNIWFPISIISWDTYISLRFLKCGHQTIVTKICKCFQMNSGNSIYQLVERLVWSGLIVVDYYKISKASFSALILHHNGRQ